MISNMSSDLIHNVNKLLSLGVGDPNRLEHIRKSYIQSKTLWETDRRYLEHLINQYLSAPPESKTTVAQKVNLGDSVKIIYCWKCGSKTPHKANFCMNCGVELYEVGKESEDEQTPRRLKKKKPIVIGRKIPIIIGVSFIVIVVAGFAYYEGFFEGVMDKYSSNIVLDDLTSEKSTPADTTQTSSDSRCGAGTVFDSDTNSCVLDSRCGAGTVFDSVTNSCVLVK